MKSLVHYLAVGLGCLTLSGCLLPSHPTGPLVGLRIDHGQPVLYLPLCPGEHVVSARIDDPRGDGKTLWQGELPARPGNNVVAFSPSDWGQRTGRFSYEEDQTFAIEVYGSQRLYASGADDGKVITDLPPGSYDVDGKVTTAAEIDQESHCEKSG